MLHGTIVGNSLGLCDFSRVLHFALKFSRALWASWTSNRLFVTPSISRQEMTATVTEAQEVKASERPFSKKSFKVKGDELQNLGNGVNSQIYPTEYITLLTTTFHWEYQGLM